MRARLFLLILVLCSRTLGCGMFRPEYAIAIRNSTSEEIDDAAIQLGQYRSTFGVVGIHATATHSSLQEPIPETAVVEWRSGDGQLHRQEVHVRSSLPASFVDDDIIFDIQPGEIVTLRLKTRPGKGVIKQERSQPAR